MEEVVSRIELPQSLSGDPVVIVADFNETLVRERLLPAWCRQQLRSLPLSSRIGFAARMAAYGVAARAADVAGRDVLAAAIGYRILAGIRLSALLEWTARSLTPNLRAYAALTRITGEVGPVTLLVVSRGSPDLVIRDHFFRPDVRQMLSAAGVVSFPRIEAPTLAEQWGVLTGATANPARAKRYRASLVPPGGAYLGDHRDRRWAKRAAGRCGMRFVQVR